MSYNVEQAKGDDAHNVVTIVMHQFHVGVHDAMDVIAEWHQRLADEFLALYRALPSWGPEIDAQLVRYVDGIGNWVRANDAWSFESERYFGRNGPAIERSRWVELLPRVQVSADRPTDAQPQACGMVAPAA